MSDPLNWRQIMACFPIAKHRDRWCLRVLWFGTQRYLNLLLFPLIDYEIRRGSMTWDNLSSVVDSYSHFLNKRLCLKITVERQCYISLHWRSFSSSYFPNAFPPQHLGQKMSLFTAQLTLPYYNCVSTVPASLEITYFLKQMFYLGNLNDLKFWGQDRLLICIIQIHVVCICIVPM